ncbi:MAG: ABC transporter permease [bacterium]
MSDTNNNLWDMLEIQEDTSNKSHGKNRTFAGDVWNRFKRKKSALIGLLIILFMVSFAVIGPAFTPYDYRMQQLDFVNIPPYFNAIVSDTTENLVYITPNLKAIEVTPKGELVGTLTRIKDDFNTRTITFDNYGETIYVSYADNDITPMDENGNANIKTKFMWNKTYLLGSDALGRDILTRLMYGARISFLVAFVAATVNIIIGIIYGGLSAYFGGVVDNIMMRIVEIISTIPLMLYVILIMMFFQNGLVSIIIALGTVYWVDMARVVRAQSLTLKEQDFIYAAKTMGSSTWFILTKHLIPNSMGPILVTVTMLIPSAIFMEAFMSFIGIGIAAPMASLGTMCNDAIESLRVAPYQMIMPAFAICITMFAFNFIGDGLRDALDPKLIK